MQGTGFKPQHSEKQKNRRSKYSPKELPINWILLAAQRVLDVLKLDAQTWGQNIMLRCKPHLSFFLRKTPPHTSLTLAIHPSSGPFLPYGTCLETLPGRFWIFHYIWASRGLGKKRPQESCALVNAKVGVFGACVLKVKLRVLWAKAGVPNPRCLGDLGIEVRKPESSQC